jgi:hypothetical protein
VEFWLREQQGLSSPGTSEYSSSDEEEEESDGGRASPERWEPSPPPSPRAAEAAEETAPGAGAGAPAAREPAREATRATTAPARAAEMAGGEAVATPAEAAAPAEPPEEEETRVFHPEVGNCSPIAVSFRSARASLSRLCVRRVAPTMHALAPAKVLRSDAVVPTKRRSSRRRGRLRAR